MLQLFFTLIMAVVAANANVSMSQKGEVAIFFKAYKTPSKTPIDGQFEKVKFRPASSSAQTLGEIFVNSYIDIESKSAVVKTKEKENELLKYCFDTMTIHDIKAKITDMKPNKSTNSKVRTGKFFVNISMNGVLRNIPMDYIFKNGTITINGVIDLHEFNAGLIHELVNQEFDRQHQERLSQKVEIVLRTIVSSL